MKISLNASAIALVALTVSLSGCGSLNGSVNKPPGSTASDTTSGADGSSSASSGGSGGGSNNPPPSVDTSNNLANTLSTGVPLINGLIHTAVGVLPIASADKTSFEKLLTSLTSSIDFSHIPNLGGNTWGSSLLSLPAYEIQALGQGLSETGKTMTSGGGDLWGALSPLFRPLGGTIVMAGKGVTGLAQPVSNLTSSDLIQNIAQVTDHTSASLITGITPITQQLTNLTGLAQPVHNLFTVTGQGIEQIDLSQSNLPLTPQLDTVLGAVGNTVSGLGGGGVIGSQPWLGSGGSGGLVGAVPTTGLLGAVSGVTQGSIALVNGVSNGIGAIVAPTLGSMNGGNLNGAIAPVVNTIGGGSNILAPVTGLVSNVSNLSSPGTAITPITNTVNSLSSSGLGTGNLTTVVNTVTHTPVGGVVNGITGGGASPLTNTLNAAVTAPVNSGSISGALTPVNNVIANTVGSAGTPVLNTGSSTNLVSPIVNAVTGLSNGINNVVNSGSGSHGPSLGGLLRH